MSAEEPQTPKQPIHPSMLSKLDPEYVEFHNKVIQYITPPHTLPWSPELRNAPAVPGASDPLEVGKVKDFELEHTNMRSFTPEGEGPSEGWPVFIFFHGGGWTFGSIASETTFATNMCVRAKCVVISVNYRLAPEYKYPAAVEDAVESLQWVIKNGKSELNVDLSKIAVGGSSSGGNLAAILALKVLSPTFTPPLPSPLLLQLLIVPVTDNTATDSPGGLWESNKHTPWLTPERMNWFKNNYLPNPSDWTNWDASPIFAPKELLGKTPNAWIGVAEVDILKEEGVVYGEKLKGAGVKEVEVVVYKGGPHPIMAMDDRISNQRPGRPISPIALRQLPVGESATTFKYISTSCSVLAATTFLISKLGTNMSQTHTPTHEVVDFGEPFHASRLVLGEAPIYRPEDGTLHYVDPLADPPEIHILPLSDYNAQTIQPRVLKLTDSISVAAFRKDHPYSYIGARLLGFAFIDEKTGEIEELKQMLPDSARGKLRFNDGAVDSKGRFWAGSMDLTGMSLPLNDPYIPQGRLWRYDSDGTTTEHVDGIYCSNGIGWSPDNKYMYFSDSYGRVVWRYEFDEESGRLGSRIDFIDFRVAGDYTTGNRTAKEIPEHLKGGEPDGMVLDTKGNVWLALWGKGCVLCFDSEGTLVREIVAKDTPYLTCTGWAGKGLDVLYCTSAHRHGLGGEKGGALFSIQAGKRWGVKGLEKYRFGG